MNPGEPRGGETADGASRVSIAMATCNGEDWVEAQLASFVEQHRRPDELVVCDDASDDATLERVRASYHMVGLPINVTYTDRNAIIKRVRETNIFLADAKKIQFALSVYVHAYPNQVCSVWVYCASLEDLRAGSSSRSS